MSIFKDTFRPFVRDQLTIREHLISTGNPSNDGETRKLKTSDRKVKLSGNDITLPPGSHYQYTLNRQCGIRLTSLVDYVEDVEITLENPNSTEQFETISGANLSKRFILEGGTLSNKSTPRGGITSPDNKSNLAYGDPFLGSNGNDDTGFGIVPMPGIIDIQVRTKTAYGSLREAKINFECHNRKQLAVLEMLYMRPGYAVLLEWGWMPYINNNGAIVNSVPLVADNIGNEGENGPSILYTNSVTQDAIFNTINDLKRTTSGNYDACLGFVKNFGFQAREDGGYTCFTEIVTIGEVIESLKAPSLSSFSPEFLKNTPTPQVTTQNTSESDSDSSEETEDELDAETRSGTTETRFNTAIELGIIPEYNGIEGLTKAIKTYSTYNPFTLTNPQSSAEAAGALYSTIYNNVSLQNNVINPLILPDLKKFLDISNFEIDEAKTLAEEQGVEYDNNDNLSTDLIIDAETQAQLDFFEEAGGGLNLSTRTRTTDGYFQPIEEARLRETARLLVFRGAKIEEVLKRKLLLPSDGDLKNYIIPRGPVKFGNVRTANIVELGGEQSFVTKYSKHSYRNDQPFIRWDALTVLINDALIPQSENLKTPVNVVADRIYDTGNGKDYRLDPLKYTSITQLSRDNRYRFVYDFSTDPNVCILPNQFATAEQEVIKEQLGYNPDITKFPALYTQGKYGRANVKYNNTPISANIELLKEDAYQRIGNIFLNVNMIDDIATKNKDNPDYTVGNFITDIWKEVNKVCPNHNFVLVDDKESNNLYIIDLPVDKNETPDIADLHEFVPFSNKNIFRSFSYTSNVPSSMTSTIAIQAQDPRSIQDIDGVTFAAFNRAIKNRLFSTNTTSTFQTVKANANQIADSLNTKRQKLFAQITEFANDFFANLSNEANGIEVESTNITSVLKEYQQLITYDGVVKGAGTSFTSVIPLEFNATMDGISGIVIGNLFKIQKDRLPKAYSKSNIGFIVFNEEQKITAGGDWTTDISGKMIVLDDLPVKLPTSYEIFDDSVIVGPVTYEHYLVQTNTDL